MSDENVIEGCAALCWLAGRQICRRPKTCEQQRFPSADTDHSDHSQHDGCGKRHPKPFREPRNQLVRPLRKRP